MKAVNAGDALARVLVDEFARAGLTHACIAPGSRSAPLARAFVEDDRIATHMVVDERSASFVALGIAKAHRRPVAVLSTSGTAAAHFHPAVVEAHEARVPLLVVTADRPPELRATGANQTIDQIKLYGDAVRWFCEVGAAAGDPSEPRYWRSVACRAWAAARGSPAGPVHLNVAFREPLAPVPDDTGRALELAGRPDGRPWTETTEVDRLPAQSQVDWLAERVQRNRRGLIVAGDGVSPSPSILELARVAAWPVLAEPTSGLRAGAEAISTYDALLRLDDLARAHRPDFVIRLGKIGLSKALAAHLGADVPQVLIDPDGAWLDPDRALERVVACDPGALAGDVAKAIEPRRDTGWLESWLSAERAARSAIDAALDGSERPSEPRTARDIAALVPAGASVVVAASMPVRDLDWFMAPRTDVRVLANRGANGIDGFASTALGVALTDDGPTFGLAGDLALIHDQNGLLLAAREPIDLTIVVVNNDGGGIFSFLPHAEFPHFERLFGTSQELDFAKFAALYGCDHIVLERASDLSDALMGSGTRIVEVRTDRRANVELHQRLWAEVARSVADGGLHRA